MVKRSGFVSNSSSSSFIIRNENHPGVKVLQENDEVMIEGCFVEDLRDNATWNCLSAANLNWREFLEQTSFNG